MKCWLPIPAELEEVQCAVCGTGERDLLLPHDWFGFPVTLGACRRCGFVYCSPRPTERFMARFYRHHYLLFYEGWSELTPEYIRAHQLNEAAQDRVTRYSELVPLKGRTLDVGCGAGFFLAELRRARSDIGVQGIEPGRMQACYASQRLGVDVFQGTYAEFPHPEPYDLVTAFHVAEHVPDLGHFFAFLRRSVSPDGYVVVESPNLDGSWQDLSMFHIAHLYAFTQGSLRQLARKHGFAIVRITTGESGWDRPNLHAVLRPTAKAQFIPERVPVTAAVLERFQGVVVPRWICVARSWTKLLLRYLGFGRTLDLWRLRRRTPTS